MLSKFIVGVSREHPLEIPLFILPVVFRPGIPLGILPSISSKIPLENFQDIFLEVPTGSSQEDSQIFLQGLHHEIH